MNVVIIGFEDLQTATIEMEKFIATSGIYVFNAVCGGSQQNGVGAGIGELWAKKNGVSILWVWDENKNRLLNKICELSDFVVADLRNHNPFAAGVVRKMRDLGKHGQVLGDW